MQVFIDIALTIGYWRALWAFMGTFVVAGFSIRLGWEMFDIIFNLK